LPRRSFRPVGPDVARRTRDRISEDHKSRKIGTGKIAGKKEKEKEKKKGEREGKDPSAGRDRKRKGWISD